MRLFSQEGMQERQIADVLNREGVASESGTPWTRGRVGVGDGSLGLWAAVDR